jgi:hypothetical protein
MAANGRRNRPDELKLTEALATGASYRDAAIQAGCSERTARRRMADPDFRSDVRSVRSTILDRTVGVLAREPSTPPGSCASYSTPRLIAPASVPPGHCSMLIYAPSQPQISTGDSRPSRRPESSTGD